MKSIISCLTLTIIILFFAACSGSSNEPKIGTYEDVRKQLNGVEMDRSEPGADIGGLEAEVNNGGFNQYFFNSSGQNCFETLRQLRTTSKTKTADLLEAAINAINPHHLPEKELIEKIRARKVAELDDSLVNVKLDSLSDEFYKLP